MAAHRFPDFFFFVDHDFVIDLIFIFILSPPASEYNVEIIEKDNYNLRLISHSAVFAVGKKNFEFQIIFIRISDQLFYKIRGRDRMIKYIK
jgi:hypothetical protein